MEFFSKQSIHILFVALFIDSMQMLWKTFLHIGHLCMYDTFVSQYEHLVTAPCVTALPPLVARFFLAGDEGGRLFFLGDGVFVLIAMRFFTTENFWP